MEDDETGPAPAAGSAPVEAQAPAEADRVVRGYSHRRALYLLRQDSDGLMGPYLKDAVVSCASAEEAMVSVRAALFDGWWLDIRGHRRVVPAVDVIFEDHRINIDRIGLSGEIMPGIVVMAFLVGDAEQRHPG